MMLYEYKNNESNSHEVAINIIISPCLNPAQSKQTTTNALKLPSISKLF